MKGTYLEFDNNWIATFELVAQLIAAVVVGADADMSDGAIAVNARDGHRRLLDRLTAAGVEADQECAWTETLLSEGRKFYTEKPKEKERANLAP